ncbi:MAG: META domain-containing protein [Alistipes sp.]|nr:META domain-containing protein [Alistipes sp.]
MNTLTKSTTALLLALLLTSCCPCRSYQKKTRRSLTGTTWQLIQLDGRSVQPREGAFSLTLAEGRVSGVGACNRLSGTYTTTEKRALAFGPIASTRIACPEQEQERKFLEALESTTHYDMDGPMLLLLREGELRAVLQAVDE